jgi:hypothetical protein
MFSPNIKSAKEVWETSQNPLVYTVSGVIENLTGKIKAFFSFLFKAYENLGTYFMQTLFF